MLWNIGDIAFNRNCWWFRKDRGIWGGPYTSKDFAELGYKDWLEARKPSAIESSYYPGKESYQDTLRRAQTLINSLWDKYWSQHEQRQNWTPASTIEEVLLQIENAVGYQMVQDMDPQVEVKKLKEKNAELQATIDKLNTMQLPTNHTWLVEQLGYKPGDFMYNWKLIYEAAGKLAAIKQSLR